MYGRGNEKGVSSLTQPHPLTRARTADRKRNRCRWPALVAHRSHILFTPRVRTPLSMLYTPAHTTHPQARVHGVDCAWGMIFTLPCDDRSCSSFLPSTNILTNTRTPHALALGDRAWVGVLTLSAIPRCDHTRLFHAALFAAMSSAHPHHPHTHTTSCPR